LKPTTFCETVGDKKGKAIVITMHYSLAEVETETPGDTLPDVEAEASSNTLAARLPKVKPKKVDQTLTDVKGASLL